MYNCNTQGTRTLALLQSQTSRVSRPPDVLACGIWEKHANSWEAAVLTTVQPYHPRHVQSDETPARTHTHTHISVSDFQGSFLEYCCNGSSIVTMFPIKQRRTHDFMHFPAIYWKMQLRLTLVQLAFRCTCNCCASLIEGLRPHTRHTHRVVDVSESP